MSITRDDAAEEAEGLHIGADGEVHSMAEHTPEPWEVRPSSNKGNGTAWRDIVSTGSQFAPSYVGEALECDAQYIVHAANAYPAMLEALEDMVAIVGEALIEGDIESADVEARHELARAAISKARQEA